MVYSFAWVDGGDAFVDRVDEDVFAFELSHLEGEFATLNVEIRNPRVGLLKHSRMRFLMTEMRLGRACREESSSSRFGGQ